MNTIYFLKKNFNKIIYFFIGSSKICLVIGQIKDSLVLITDNSSSCSSGSASEG